MHLTLMLTGSLVPAELAVELAAAAQMPALQQRLARAAQQTETMSSTASADADWIATQVFGVAQAAPTAPYAWAALTGTPPTAPTLWHADPIHVAVGRDSLIVHELAGASPTEVDSDALIAAANETLRDDRCALVRAGEKWFLCTEAPWSMAPLPLSAVIGRPLEIASRDNDSGRWTRLHNEIQMRWHDHPVNQARESQGKPPINALWLHGGGTWQRHPPLRWPRVHSDRAELRGIAAAAGAGVADAAEAVTGDALLVWDDALTAARAGDWSSWIEAISTVDHRLGALPPAATLEIVLCGRHRTKTWIARPSDRLRIWRRASVAEALAE